MPKKITLEEIYESEHLEVNGYHQLLGNFFFNTIEEAKYLHADPIGFVSERLFIPRSMTQWAVKQDMTGYDLQILFDSFENPHSKKPKTKTKKEGFIYFVREESRGHVKIGRTIDLEDRLKTFTVVLPFKIELATYFKCKDYVRAEKLLHEFYEYLRVDGEWFRMGANNIETATSETLLKQLGIEVIK